MHIVNKELINFYPINKLNFKKKSKIKEILYKLYSSNEKRIKK